MMKRTKNLRKRGLALFLALVMCFGLLQTTAWAEDVESTPTDPTTIDESNDPAEPTAPDPEGGDDVDKDTPETNVTPDTDDSVPKTEAGGVDYEKDERENAGDTTPSDDPDHAGYPWAEDKADSRTEEVVVDKDTTVTVPVEVKVNEGDPTPIEGGTSETDTWTGKGEKDVNWTEENEGGKDVDVKVDVDVTVKGDETTTNTTTSDALGVHETTTVNGQETVDTTIKRTEEVQNPDNVDKFETPSTTLDRGHDAEELDEDEASKRNPAPKPSDNPTLTNQVQDVSATATLTGNKTSATGTGSSTDEQNEEVRNKLVEELQKTVEKDVGTKTEPVMGPDKEGNDIEVGTKTTTVTVDKKADGYTKTTITEIQKHNRPLSEALPDKYEGTNPVLTDAERQDALNALIEAQKKAVESLNTENVTYEVNPTYEVNDKGELLDGKEGRDLVLSGYNLVKTVKTQDKATAQDVITLPERPLESVTTAENGDEIRVEVTDRKDANGDTIGYVKTTTVTSASGSVSTKTEVLSGTKSSTSTTTADSTHVITTTVTGVVLNKETSTVDTYEKITETETKTITDVTGRQVTVTLTVGDDAEGKNHGDFVTTTLGKGNSAGNDLRTGGLGSYLNHGTEGLKFEDSQFAYTGNTGIASDFYVGLAKEKDGVQTPNGHYYAHQFEVYDGINKSIQYAYCTDLAVDPQKGHNYEMKNLEDSGYFSEDDAKIIRAMAMNGYWGDNNTTGNLSDFKNFIQECGYTGSLEDMSDGLALSITQAVIWKYGNSDSKTEVIRDNPFGDLYMDNTITNSAQKVALGNAVYNYLINNTDKVIAARAETSGRNDTAVINKGDIKSASVTVGAKVENSDRYDTEVSFTLNVRQSKLNSENLVVELGGETFQIIGDELKIDGNSRGSITYDGKGNCTITLKNVSLASGNNSVRLHGNQSVSRDAYIMKASTNDHTNSQTFVTAASGTRAVDLTFTLNLGVIEGTNKIESETTSKTETQNDYDLVVEAEAVDTTDVTVTTIETETLRYWDARTVETNTYEYGDDDDDDDDDDVVTGDDDDDDDVVTGDDDDDDTTTVEEEPTPLAEAPEIQDEVTVPEENVPLAEAPEEEEEVEIPEEDVPLAEVPATGDISGAWYAMTILAGCGLAVLTLRKKEQDA